MESGFIAALSREDPLNPTSLVLRIVQGFRMIVSLHSLLSRKQLEGKRTQLTKDFKGNQIVLGLPYQKIILARVGMFCGIKPGDLVGFFSHCFDKHLVLKPFCIVIFR